MDKTRKPYPEKGKERIKAALLVNKLQEHVLDGKELSATQIRAAEILLRKVVPDQAATHHSGESSVKVEVDEQSAKHITDAVRSRLAK